MNRKLIALIGIWACAIGLMLTAAPFLSANAGEPPSERCLAVTKQEYDSANRQMLLQTRFTAYERTGYLGQRHYWFCRS
jgi:hypothetical protein